MKVIKDLMVAGVVLAANGSAIAKQFILQNTSPHHQPLSIELQVVRQHPGQPIVRGETQIVRLISSQPLSFDDGGFQLVGIRILSINGHKIPDDNEVFTHLTDAKYSKQPSYMDIALEELGDGHGNISVNVYS